MKIISLYFAMTVLTATLTACTGPTNKSEIWNTGMHGSSYFAMPELDS